MTDTQQEAPKPAAELKGANLLHTVAGGVLMGIANVIPGVSGGTMILALGLYEKFIDAVADLTRLRFRLGSIVFLALLGASAAMAVLAAVGPINWGLANHQHIMFALFIGLTLGGVPLVWKEMRPVRAAGVVGAIFGFALVTSTSLALSQMDLPVNFFFLFIGGVVGAAAMVLPGISGSFLLLAMGLYFPITEAVEQFKDAIKALDVAGALEPGFGVGLPVAMGVAVGIAGLTNLLKALLARYRQATMGALLGLLLGSVVFLYPFREPGHRDPFEAAAPATPANVILVLFCVALGFAVTFILPRIGAREGERRA